MKTQSEQERPETSDEEASPVDALVMPLRTVCAECGEEMALISECSTLVGYASPPGHNHDDNCKKR